MRLAEEESSASVEAARRQAERRTREENHAYGLRSTSDEDYEEGVAGNGTANAAQEAQLLEEAQSQRELEGSLRRRLSEALWEADACGDVGVVRAEPQRVAALVQLLGAQRLDRACGGAAPGCVARPLVSTAYQPGPEEEGPTFAPTEHAAEDGRAEHQQHSDIFELPRGRGAVAELSAASLWPQRLSTAAERAAVLGAGEFFWEFAPGAAAAASGRLCAAAVAARCGVALAPAPTPNTLTEVGAEWAAVGRCVADNLAALEAACLRRGAGTPLVLRGAARGLPAFQNWASDAALRTKYGWLALNVEQARWEDRDSGLPQLTMRLRDFLARYNSVC
eukprot:SAG11_NODE_1702_length_4421_cov_6.229755_2_plen_336_part_00